MGLEKPEDVLLREITKILSNSPVSHETLGERNRDLLRDFRPGQT
jgi:hypothetical protein